MCSAPLIGLSRHRLLTDGEGVTTLVAFHGCTLRCRYCLNPQCLSDDTPCRLCTPQELYEEVRQDELYFLATRGGVTFGGGEPLMRSRFIEEFRRLCGPLWRINVETSLNVPAAHLQRLLTVVDHFIIDIKDLDPDRYRRYTGRDNTRVLGNLRLLLRRGLADRCTLRLPLIPNHNTEEQRADNHRKLQEMEFTHFDLFTYKIPSGNEG